MISVSRERIKTLPCLKVCTSHRTWRIRNEFSFYVAGKITVFIPITLLSSPTAKLITPVVAHWLILCFVGFKWPMQSEKLIWAQPLVARILLRYCLALEAEETGPRGVRRLSEEVLASARTSGYCVNIPSGPHSFPPLLFTIDIGRRQFWHFNIILNQWE